MKSGAGTGLAQSRPAIQRERRFEARSVTKMRNPMFAAMLDVLPVGRDCGK
jgi:hypothetical protein